MKLRCYVLISVFDFDLEKEKGNYFELTSDFKTHVSLTQVNFKPIFLSKTLILQVFLLLHCELHEFHDHE